MDKTDRAIKEECEARGLTFRPWEIPPWEVSLGEKCPWPSDRAGAQSWPKALELRRQLLDELDLEGP